MFKFDMQIDHDFATFTDEAGMKIFVIAYPDAVIDDLCKRFVVLSGDPEESVIIGTVYAMNSEELNRQLDELIKRRLSYGSRK